MSLSPLIVVCRVLKNCSGTGILKTKNCMQIRIKQKNHRNAVDAFTLVEVLMAIVIMAMVMTGLLYGYVQANRMAEFSSLSLAAQSYASQGIEQTRSAQWNSQMWPITNGPDTGDERPPTTNSSGVVTSHRAGGHARHSHHRAAHFIKLCLLGHELHQRDTDFSQPAIATNPIGCRMDLCADPETVYQHRDHPART